MLVGSHGECAAPEACRRGPHSLSTWDDARAAAYLAATALPPAQLALADALGSVLAEPLRAFVSVPLINCSAMDGYAVCGPSPWSVIACLRTGEGAPPPLRSGTAWEVVTGAPLPLNTAGVLPYEQACRTGKSVNGPVKPGQHIRRAGEECTAGEEVLPAGAVASPPVLGLAAALGHDTLSVRRAPRVLALITGDELLDTGLPSPGRVRDAIGPMLPGLVAWAGGRFQGATRLTDSTALLTVALHAAESDMILVSGSSSGGPADHLRCALATLGAELIVDGVACRPGHPQALARLSTGPLVVGLPGNPLAAVAAFLTLALPAITGLRGRPLPTLPPAAALPTSPGITRLIPVRVRGKDIAELPHIRSAMLRGMAAADALAIVSPFGDVRLHPVPGSS
jgi:molybdopterin molybdotransferase